VPLHGCSQSWLDVLGHVGINLYALEVIISKMAASTQASSCDVCSAEDGLSLLIKTPKGFTWLAYVHEDTVPFQYTFSGTISYSLPRSSVKNPKGRVLGSIILLMFLVMV